MVPLKPTEGIRKCILPSKNIIGSFCKQSLDTGLQIQKSVKFCKERCLDHVGLWSAKLIDKEINYPAILFSNAYDVFWQCARHKYHKRY